MSIYQVEVEVAAVGDIVLAPAMGDLPAMATLPLDAEAICSVLYQAFEQELSVAYIERFLAAYKAEVAARSAEVGR